MNLFTIQIEKEENYSTVKHNELILANALMDVMLSVHPMPLVERNVKKIETCLYLMERVPLAAVPEFMTSERPVSGERGPGKIQLYHLALKKDGIDLARRVQEWVRNVLTRANYSKDNVSSHIYKCVQDEMEERNIIRELFTRKKVFSTEELTSSMTQINTLVDCVNTGEDTAICAETNRGNYYIECPVETYNLGLAKYFYSYLIPNVCVMGSCMWEVLTNIRIRKHGHDTTAYVCTNALFSRTLVNDLKYQAPKMKILELPKQAQGLDRDKLVPMFVFSIKGAVTLNAKYIGCNVHSKQ